MNWDDFLEIAGVFILSAVKFGLAGVPSAVFAKWSFLKVLTVTISGGITGTIVFTFVSEAVIKSYKKVKNKIVQKNKLDSKPKFTLTNKIIIKVKQRLGLFGLAILGPSVLSIPLGTFLGIRYFKDRKKVMSYMFVSIIAWAIILYFFYHNIYRLIFH
ncbi:MAG: hypothetical protein IT235_01065 [Bacteroidia bacterium]|nr:hypothetical protein [Bacteroidia bacterium]